MVTCAQDSAQPGLPCPGHARQRTACAADCASNSVATLPACAKGWINSERPNRSPMLANCEPLTKFRECCFEVRLQCIQAVQLAVGPSTPCKITRSSLAFRALTTDTASWRRLLLMMVLHKFSIFFPESWLYSPTLRGALIWLFPALPCTKKSKTVSQAGMVAGKSVDR